MNIWVKKEQEDKIMQMSDVIADMLTRIRNAGTARHETVDIPASNMKKAIADIRNGGGLSDEALAKLEAQIGSL